jgi:hypothetical protein
MLLSHWPLTSQRLAVENYLLMFKATDTFCHTISLLIIQLILEDRQMIEGRFTVEEFFFTFILR